MIKLKREENDVERSEWANCLALHHFTKEEIDIEKCFYYAENWMLSHGLTPTKISGKGRSNISYSRGKKSLIKDNFSYPKEKGEIWVAALPSENTYDLEMTGAIFNFDFYNRSHEKSDLIFAWDASIQSMDKKYVENLIKDLKKFTNFQYGYCFKRRFEKGPSLYVSGLIFGNVSESEGDEMTNWSNHYSDPRRSYKLGDLRDVYPMNILTEPHLSRELEGTSLREWITSSPRRGTLTELQPGLWSWWVDTEDIPSVRKVLRASDFLVCFRS